MPIQALPIQAMPIQAMPIQAMPIPFFRSAWVRLPVSLFRIDSASAFYASGVVPASRFLALTASFLAPTASFLAPTAQAESLWEVTADSRLSLERGLENLSQTQTSDGNWGTKDLGVVSMGVLAYMSDGHAPGRGKYGSILERALDYVLTNAKPSGLLNINGEGRDMYNHGLSTFVLGQAYGMTNNDRVGPVLDRALTLIIKCQGPDGGWDYKAAPIGGHDLSLAVMQAKALRSAVDSGFSVPPAVTDLAIRHVRRYYAPAEGDRNLPEEEQKKRPGQFTYDGNYGRKTLAMAAAGVVCLQEFAQYDDWRIPKNIDVIEAAIAEAAANPAGGLGMDAYTLYYVAQALYQVGGEPWQRSYPLLREKIIRSQNQVKNTPAYGGWGDIYQTSVCCFVLAIPNRYLPILQEGKIDSLRKQFSK